MLCTSNSLTLHVYPSLFIHNLFLFSRTDNQVDDRVLMNSIQNKMDLLQLRMQKMDKSWQDATHGLYLNPRGEIITADGRVYQTRQPPEGQSAPTQQARGRPVRRTRSGRLIPRDAPLVISQVQIVLSFLIPYTLKCSNKDEVPFIQGS